MEGIEIKMNLSKAPIHIPDVTRAARAGAAIGNETANQLRAFASLGQQMREGNARTAMAWNDQAMNLRERQQRLDQSADLHPYKILQAQESLMSQNLSNQLTQQQLVHNVSKHEVDQLNALADLTGKESRNAITKKSLEDKIQQDSEAPTLQAAINAIRSYANDPKNADVDTLNKVTSAGLSGRNLEIFNKAMDEASQVILDRRDDTAVGMAYRSQQQDLAVLMQSGALLVQDKDDPAKISAAKAVHRRNRANAILDEDDRHPKSGSPKAQTLEARHTKQNGFLDEAAFRQALAAEAGFIKTGMSVDDTTGASRTTYTRKQPPRPVSAKDRLEMISRIIEDGGEDLKTGKPNISRNEAADIVDEQIRKANQPIGVSASKGGKSAIDSKPKIKSTDKQNLANYIFSMAMSKVSLDDNSGPFGWQWDGDVEYKKDSAGNEYVSTDSDGGNDGVDFWFSPNAGDSVKKYKKSLNESGLDVNPKIGIPENDKSIVPGRVYWNFDNAGFESGATIEAFTVQFNSDGSVAYDERGDLILNYIVDHTGHNTKNLK